jgi:hypothetical protein
MKRVKLLLVLALVVAVTSAEAQIRKTVYGKGPVTSEERSAGNFHSIRVSTGINVYLSQGDRESIRVEADENLHEYILTEVRGGVLRVYTDANIRSSESRKVYVTMKEIRSISTSSAGDVIGQTPIVTDLLELSTSSAGDINIEVKAREINATTSSSGDISLRGSADNISASTSSAGDLKALDLTVREADITASSAGDAKITVTERLKARASSAGDIYYKGNPKYVDAHASSAGSVKGY